MNQIPVFLLFVLPLAPSGFAQRSGNADRTEPEPTAPPEHTDEPPLDPLELAWQLLAAAEVELVRVVVDEIERRIEATNVPGLQTLLNLRDRARYELKIMPAPEPAYFKATVYAPGQVVRRFAEPDSLAAAAIYGKYEGYVVEPLYLGSVRYDYGRNTGIDTGKTITAMERLRNYLFGYPPGADILVAWLEHKFDHRDELDPYARYFERAYCTLNGDCSKSITLYEAYASSQGVETPDADAIAFAREILEDDSFVSPIPQGPGATELYAEIHAGFLRYFIHRTLTEYFANLFVNPEAPMDLAHVSLRERILYSFHLDEMDPTRIRNRFIRTSSRGGYITEIDDLADEDDSWRWWGRYIAGQRNEQRWAIANIAYDVLREFDFLR